MKVTTKAKGKKTSPYEALATCPVNGAGWCPYPFSMAQLKRRLKAKAAAAEAQAKTSASSTTTADQKLNKKTKQLAVKASS
jgi:hypothetical protein